MEIIMNRSVKNKMKSLAKLYLCTNSTCVFFFSASYAFLPKKLRVAEGHEHKPRNPQSSVRIEASCYNLNTSWTSAILSY